MPKRAIQAALTALLIMMSAHFACAQRRISPYFGLGFERDSQGTSVPQGCPTGQIFDGVICEAGPKMGGLFGAAGVDFMFKKHLGVDAEFATNFSRKDYLPDDSLKYRPLFYDLNAEWQPFSSTRFIPFLEGGVGALKLSLKFTQPTSLTGVSTLSGFSAGTDTSHFQLHGAFGVKVYVHGNIFVKPQFDLHYATNLTDEFGRNLVIGFIGAVGYTFGQR